ncbi:MAG: hypothetical protein JSV82_02565, partial [Planctomycetota bacterium]
KNCASPPLLFLWCKTTTTRPKYNAILPVSQNKKVDLNQKTRFWKEKEILRIFSLKKKTFAEGGGLWPL